MKSNIFFFCLLFICTQLVGQNSGFRLSAIVGMNNTQIDGDSMAGYKNLGLHVGGKISYQNKGYFDVSLEMLYSERGAARNFSEKNPKFLIKANYIELPLVLSIRDWYVKKKDYFKVRVDAGVSVGYLIQIESLRFGAENFKNTDLSWFVGGGYRFSKRVGLSIRYQSALTNMYSRSEIGPFDFKSYFYTVRGEVYF